MSIYRRVTLQPDGSLRTTGLTRVHRGGLVIDLSDGEVETIEVDARRWLDSGETLTAVTLAGATTTLTNTQAVLTCNANTSGDLQLTTSSGRVRKIPVNADHTMQYDYGRVSV